MLRVNTLRAALDQDIGIFRVTDLTGRQPASIARWLL